MSLNQISALFAIIVVLFFNEIFVAEKIDNIAITSVANEIQEKLLKIQSRVNRVNLAMLTKSPNEANLQEEMFTIEREFSLLPSLDDVAVPSAFIKSFTTSLQAQIQDTQKIIRNRIEESRNQCLIPVIVEDIKAGRFEEAEANLKTVGDNGNIFLIVHEIYGNNMNNSELVLRLAAELKELNIFQDVLMALWNEIQTNVHLDPDILIKFIRIIDQEITNRTDILSAERKQDIIDLRSGIIEQLLSICAEKFKADLLTGNYISKDDSNILPHSLYFLDNNLYREAMHRAIDALHTEITKMKLIESLYAYGRFYYGEIIEPMAYVFDKMNRSGELDDPAVFTLVYYFQLISNFSTFVDVQTLDASEYNRTLSGLSASLRNLYFSDRICLKNVHYDEVLFADNDTQTRIETGRAVKTNVLECDRQSQYREWIVRRSDKGIANELTFQTEAGEFLYSTTSEFSPSNSYVVTRTARGGNTSDEEGIFRIVLHGNAIAMKSLSDDKFICASSQLSKEGEGRFVFAMKYGYSRLPICQWTVEIC